MDSISLKERLNIDGYEYIMYVDASGDDGFKFDKDSSVCYAASCFLVKRENIDHNLNILTEIKKLMGTKETDEVKYSKVKRHRNSGKIHELLKGLSGKLYSMIAFKKMIKDPYYLDLKNKVLSSFCHVLAINALNDDFGEKNIPSVVIVIDRMKEVEMETVAELTKTSFEDNADNYKVIFRDSKDKDFQLLQIADILAGIVRCYFEQYETNQGMKFFWRTCPMCLNFKDKRLCNHQRKMYSIARDYKFEQIKRLYNKESNKILGKSLLVLPVSKTMNIYYLDCFKK